MVFDGYVKIFVCVSVGESLTPLNSAILFENVQREKITSWIELEIKIAPPLLPKLEVKLSIKNI